MIVRDKPNALKLFFILKGSIIGLIIPQILFIILISIAVAVHHEFYGEILSGSSLTPFTLLGVALSLFLGFRNNACYERWWEGRKLWGHLIVDSRSLSRQVISYINKQALGGVQVQKRLVYLTIAYNHALRHHLRKSDPWTDIENYLQPDDILNLKQSFNLPEVILRMIGEKVGDCRHKNLLSDFLVQSLDQHISNMSLSQAGCERIESTPLPFAYRLLVQRTVYIFCFILPFGLVGSLGALTPLFCGLIAYTFFGLDALSTELEQPFGMSENDLPLSAITRSIEIGLLETLGEKSTLQAFKTTNHFLI